MNDEAFYTLHRHWIWCEVIRDNFDRELCANPSIFPESIGLRQFNLASRYGAYKSLWYGLLFSLLETLKENGIKIESAEKEIADMYDSLRLYRNAVFHPQPKYWSDKLRGVMKDNDPPEKILKIHEALREFFCVELSKRNPPFTYRYEVI